MAMYQSCIYLNGNPPPPPMDDENTKLVQHIVQKGMSLDQRRKQIIKKVDPSKPLILPPLHVTTTNNRSILLLCGQSGSILNISRIPLHFTLSRLNSPTKTHLSSLAPQIGATIHSTWEHEYSTHLITPTATTTAKHLTAWCNVCPIVTPDYVEALYGRVSMEDDLPKVEDFVSPGETPMRDLSSLGEGNRVVVDCMKHYTILSLIENDEMIPLVQAAGCTNVLSLTDSSSDLSQVIERAIVESAKKGLKVVFVESKSRKCKKQRAALWKRMEEQKDVWCVQAKDVASAISLFGREEEAGKEREDVFLMDVFGNEITPIGMTDGEEMNNECEEEGKDKHGEDEADNASVTSNKEHKINDPVASEKDNDDITEKRKTRRGSPQKKRRLDDIQEEDEEEAADSSLSPEGRRQKRIKPTLNVEEEENIVIKKASSSPPSPKKETRKRKMDKEDKDDDNMTTGTTSSSRSVKKKKTSGGGWMSSSRRNTNDHTQSRPSLMSATTPKSIKKDEEEDDNVIVNPDTSYPSPSSSSPSPRRRPHHPTAIKSSSPPLPQWKNMLSKPKNGWYSIAPAGKARIEQRNIAAAHWEKELNHHDGYHHDSAILPMADSAETEARKDLVVRTDEEVRIWRRQMQQQQRRRRGNTKKDVPDFKRFHKNVVIHGSSWCRDDDGDEDDANTSFDPNTSRIRLRSVLPKESERQKQLEDHQRQLERERLAADALFADHSGRGGGGSGLRSFFRTQQKTKRSGGASSVVSSGRRVPRGGRR